MARDALVAPSSASTKLDQRRNEVHETARRIIITEGLDATTLRKIAREAGFTTGMVSHYFPDKRAVIQSTFEFASASWIDDAKSQLGRASTAFEKLCVLLRLAVPDDQTRRDEWRLWLEMWEFAHTDPPFRRVLLETDAVWTGLLEEVLGDGRTDGLLSFTSELSRTAYLLARLLDGVSLRAWLSGDWHTARVQVLDFLTTLGLPASLACEL